MKKIIKRIYDGIAWGCIISCLITVSGSLAMGNDWFTFGPHSYAKQVIAAIIVGMGWVVPTLVYDSKKLSKGMQVSIHLLIGFGIYIPCAFYMQWIPTSQGMGTLLTTVLIMLVCSFLIYLGFYFYYRNEAKKLNSRIKEKREA